MLAERNASINVDGNLPKILGNRSQMMSVFQNLIGNAVRYNDAEKKTVDIGVHKTFQHRGETFQNVFYVRDNGIGIDEQFHNEVFRIFKRLNSSKPMGPAAVQDSHL